MIAPSQSTKVKTRSTRFRPNDNKVKQSRGIAQLTVLMIILCSSVGFLSYKVGRSLQASMIAPPSTDQAIQSP